MIVNAKLRAVLSVLVIVAAGLQTQLGLPDWVHAVAGSVIAVAAIFGIFPPHIAVKDERSNG